MAAGAPTRDVSLQHTSTWAVAAVFFLLIALSLLLVQSIHLLSRWLQGRRKDALIQAVERLKDELMLLGFISMLLAVSQRPISHICVPVEVADTMLPCRRVASRSPAPPVGGGHLRRLLWNYNSNADGDDSWRPMRMLSGAGDPETNKDFCGARGKVSLVSQEGVHQLHIFIFVLAVVHVLYSVVAMALGRAKMRRWKAWEKETQTLDYQIAHDSRRFRYTRETSFARRHINFCTESSFPLWIMCFFRQFFTSVGKVDYFTLRHGFISAHFPNFKSFNFQKYIQRSLDNDFRIVLQISPAMWLLVVMLMLINVYGWYSYFWLSFLPLLVVLAIGTKLHHIVAKMALQLDQNHAVISGAPLVQPSDDFFWFGNPKLILSLLHLILFQNAFEFTFFIWIWYEFGIRSCYHEKLEVAITRVVLALVVQFMCSYITLPLYALITQMGSEFKWATQEEQTTSVLRKWHEDVRKRRTLQQHSSEASISVSAGDSIPSAQA